MAELEGNVLRPPGFGPTVTFDHPEELLASTGHGYIQKGGTVAAGTGTYKVGEPVRRDTAGNNTLWIKATHSTAEGLVRNAVDATSEKKLINVVLSGAINTNIQAINGSGGSVVPATLATTLGGKYFPKFEYIIF
jgi:hypothetical protein